MGGGSFKYENDTSADAYVMSFTEGATNPNNGMFSSKGYPSRCHGPTGDVNLTKSVEDGCPTNWHLNDDSYTTQHTFDTLQCSDDDCTPQPESGALRLGHGRRRRGRRRRRRAVGVSRVASLARFFPKGFSRASRTRRRALTTSARRRVRIDTSILVYFFTALGVPCARASLCESKPSFRLGVTRPRPAAEIIPLFTGSR